MPNILSQFDPLNPIVTAYADMDDALIMLFRDMAKIARKEIHPSRTQTFAIESLQAAYLIANPDVGG